MKQSFCIICEWCYSCHLNLSFLFTFPFLLIIWGYCLSSILICFLLFLKHLLFMEKVNGLIYWTWTHNPSSMVYAIIANLVSSTPTNPFTLRLADFLHIQGVCGAYGVSLTVSTCVFIPTVEKVCFWKNCLWGRKLHLLSVIHCNPNATWNSVSSRTKGNRKINDVNTKGNFVVCTWRKWSLLGSEVFSAFFSNHLQFFNSCFDKILPLIKLNLFGFYSFCLFVSNNQGHIYGLSFSGWQFTDFDWCDLANIRV